LTLNKEREKLLQESCKKRTTGGVVLDHVETCGGVVAVVEGDNQK